MCCRKAGNKGAAHSPLTKETRQNSLPFLTQELNIKPQNPPTSNAEGFTKNPAAFCPLQRAAPPKGSRAQHKAQQGPGQELCPRTSLVARPEPFKRGQTPLPGGPGAGGPLQGWEALERQLFQSEQPTFPERTADIPPLRGRSSASAPGEATAEPSG